MKHFRYLSYVVRHKWFVLVAGWKTSAPLWRLAIHDWSKFLPCEWFAYVETFYGGPRLGDVVYVDCIDGFGGTAKIIEQRRGRNKFKVRMEPGNTGEGQEFWAHDEEIGEVIRTQNAFDRAWLHHQHANPHHWQHWILREDSGALKRLEMPEHFVREMAADWMGAGRAITGRWDVGGWYAKNREKIQLHPKSREMVEKLIGFSSAEEPA